MARLSVTWGKDSSLKEGGNVLSVRFGGHWGFASIGGRRGGTGSGTRSRDLLSEERSMQQEMRMTERWQ